MVSFARNILKKNLRPILKFHSGSFCSAFTFCPSIQFIASPAQTSQRAKFINVINLWIRNAMENPEKYWCAYICCLLAKKYHTHTIQMPSNVHIYISPERRFFFICFCVAFYFRTESFIRNSKIVAPRPTTCRQKLWSNPPAAHPELHQAGDVVGNGSAKFSAVVLFFYSLFHFRFSSEIGAGMVVA